VRCNAPQLIERFLLMRLHTSQRAKGAELAHGDEVRSSPLSRASWR
jgi:hypothetical protein